MPIVLRFKPSIEALAVYETADVLNPSDGPIDNPLSNLNSIKFHSGLRYPRFIPSKTFNFSHTIDATLPQTNQIVNTSVNLYAHGMSDVPVVFAKYLNGSSSIIGANPTTMMPANSAWAGSIPLVRFRQNMAVWGAISANATHVVLDIFGVIPESTGSLGTYTVNGRGYVLDTTVVTDAFDADGSVAQLVLEGTRIRAGRGKFDTDFSYMRQGSTSDAVTLVKGQSMVMVGTPRASPLTDINQDWEWRYSVAGNVQTGLATPLGSSFAASFATAGL